MKIKCTLLVLLVAMFSSTLEALNLAYLPGDTSFRVSYSKEKWQELLKLPQSDPIELEYWYPGGTLCGVAGQWTLKFEKRPELLNQALRHVFADTRFWRVTGEGEFLMDGPVFFFVSPDFDLTKHSLMRRDNPNYLEILRRYPDGRNSIKQHPERYENLKEIQTDNAPEFGALPPFSLDQESFGKDYASEVIAPNGFKIIVVADAYDALLEDMKGEAEGASTIAYAITDSGVEEFSYSSGVWSRSTKGTEQGVGLKGFQP